MAAPDDTETQTAPDYSGASPEIKAALANVGGGSAPLDYGTIAQQLLQQPTLPQPDTTPVTRGLLSRIGEALGGGNVSGVMSPAQQEMAGLRSLRDFGTSLIAGSGYYPGKPALGAFAEGFQGAERSQRGSEQQAAATLAAQQQYAAGQQQQYLERLKTALPYLQMQAGASIPNPLLSANTPAVPGTSTGGGSPGGGGVPLAIPARGTGGPGAGASAPTAWLPYFQEASKETGIPVDLLIAQARQESSFDPNAKGTSKDDNEIGLFQIKPSTAAKPGFGVAGVDPASITGPDNVRNNILFGARYLKARMGGGDPNNPAVQAAGLHAYNAGGDPKYVQNVFRYRPTLAPSDPNAAVTTYIPGEAPAQTATAPAGGGGSAGRVQVASVTPTTATDGSTAAAATPPAPGQTPPAAPGETTFERFRAQNPIDPASLMPDMAQARAAQAAAAQQLSLARAGRGGDPNKSLSDYNTATDAVNKLQQEANAKVLDAQRQLYGDTMQRQQQAKLKADELAQAAKLKADELAQTAAENQRNRDAEIEKAKLASGYTIQQEQAKADMDIAKTDLNDRAADAQKAGRVIPILQQMQGQIGKMPDGFIGGLLAKYDTTGDMTGILAKMGVVDPSKATAAQMLIAARNYLSIEMKPAATGSLRVAEMDKLQSFTPGQLQTPEAQNEMAARLIAYQKRIQDERSFASTYFGRPSDPNNPNSPRIYDNRNLDKAMNAPVKYDQNGNVTGGGLGPVVPEPPSANAPDAEHQAYLNYVNRNLAPGAPYQVWEPKRNQDGSLALDVNRRPIPQRVTKLKVYQ